MSLILNRLCSASGRLGHLATRCVLEVGGVAAIPYWAAKWGGVSEEISFQIATGALIFASVRLVSSLGQDRLYEVIQENPKSWQSMIAHFFYGMGTGKNVQILPKKPLEAVVIDQAIVSTQSDRNLKISGV